MTRPALHAVPSDATVAKAGRIIAAGGVLVDYADPAADALSALVTSESGQSYAVTHGELLGWRCTCLARSTCSHILAAALAAVDQHGFDEAVAP